MIRKFKLNRHGMTRQESVKLQRKNARAFKGLNNYA